MTLRGQGDVGIGTGRPLWPQLPHGVRGDGGQARGAGGESRLKVRSPAREPHLCRSIPVGNLRGGSGVSLGGEEIEITVCLV